MDTPGRPCQRGKTADLSPAYEHMAGGGGSKKYRSPRHSGAGSAPPAKRLCPRSNQARRAKNAARPLATVAVRV